MKQTRIMVLSCLHSRVLHGAVYELLHGRLLSRHERRLFDSHHLKGVDGKANAGVDLYRLADSPVGEGEASTVIVNLESRAHLGSMFLDVSEAWATRELLQSKDRYVVLLAKDAQLIETIERKLERSRVREHEERYVFARVPFLRPLLGLHYPESRAETLAARIEVQREQGLWGDRDNEEELFEWVIKYLQRGKWHLEEEVERRAETASALTAHARRRAIETVDAATLFDGADPVERTLLYAVAYFPDLQPDDLERVMRVLLRDRTTEIDVTEAEEQTGIESPARLITKTRIKKKHRPLLDLWEEDADHYLDACHVGATDHEDGPDTVDFLEPYLRRDLLPVLRQRHPLYLRHRFERLMEEGFLFAEDRVPALRDRTISITAEMMLAEPGRFDERWLSGLLIGLDAATEKDLDLSEWLDLSSEEQRESIWEYLQSRGVRRRIFKGVSDLIREMLHHERLRSLVDRWLHELLADGRPDEVLQFVLDILRELGLGAQFDVLKWFRRLLDEATEEEREKVYEALVEVAIDLDVRIYDLLVPLAEWLPDPEQEEPTARLSSNYAVRWLVEVSLTTIHRLDPEDTGAWPSRYPLFATLRGEDERTSERIGLLVDWLFHPSMKWIQGEEAAEEIAPLLPFFRATVIEEWYWILHGVHSEDDTRSVKGGEGKKSVRVPEATEVTPADGVSDLLLSHVVSKIPPHERAQFVSYWRSIRSSYVMDLGNTGAYRSKETRRAQSRRKCSLRLERRFKAISLQDRQERRGQS